MKIRISLEASETTGRHLIDLSDLGITDAEWNKLTEQGKKDLLQDYANDLNEQPYWVVDSFETK